MLVYMKNFWILLILCSLFSCDKINSYTASFLKKKEPVDFSQVDRYPLFKNCDPLLSYQETKACFEQSFHEKVNQRIQNLKFKTELFYADTLLLKFSIDNTGHFKCIEVDISNRSKKNFPSLSSEIQRIIHGFEPVIPAQKRDIPVSTHYTIPVVIKTK